MSIAIRQGRRTLAEELRLQLADEIVRGALAPGAALDEMELARRFRVSRTPVREAIRQLTASGLIEARAHRAAVVARPSEERLIGMFEAMAELEALCAGFAAERMTGAERRALELVHEEMRALIRIGDPQRFHEVNEAFHGAIYAGAHNAYLAEIDAGDAGARAAVPPRAVPHARPAGEIAYGARPGGDSDPARRARARRRPRCAPISPRCERPTRSTPVRSRRPATLACAR